jgi:hypothetical protein
MYYLKVKIAEPVTVGSGRLRSGGLWFKSSLDKSSGFPISKLSRAKCTKALNSNPSPSKKKKKKKTIFL